MAFPHALPPERSYTIDGCTDACELVRAIVPGRWARTEILLHDPLAHQEYGRRLALPAARELVMTGGLITDLTSGIVLIRGRERVIQLRQWDILKLLASRPGAVVRSGEIIDRVWGCLPGESEAHMLRSAVNRLRGSLGPCGDLVQTIPCHGYRLMMVPPVDGANFSGFGVRHHGQ